MRLKKWFMPIIIILLLSACANSSPDEQSTNDEKYSVIRTSSSYKQDTSNKLKKYVNENEEFNEVYAVNTDSEVLIAVDPMHHDRFRLEDFRKKLEKDLKNEIHPLKLELSTDKKIQLELKKLEEELENKNLSRKQLEKNLDRIIKLSKEET